MGVERTPGAKMKNCTKNRRLLSNGKFSTRDWPTQERRETMSSTTLAGFAGVEAAPADHAGFFSRLHAAITKSRQGSADRHVARHQHLIDRLAGRVEPAGAGGRPRVVATSRTRAEEDVAARYVGDRWCDTTERKLNDELMAEHRGSFTP
jgi:hypothetical protein